MTQNDITADVTKQPFQLDVKKCVNEDDDQVYMEESVAIVAEADLIDEVLLTDQNYGQDSALIQKQESTCGLTTSKLTE